jgi:hypothetical protein
LDFWREPKQAISAVFTALGFVLALFFILGPFNDYADGWGRWILLGLIAMSIAASSLVKKLPI